MLGLQSLINRNELSCDQMVGWIEICLAQRSDWPEVVLLDMGCVCQLNGNAPFKVLFP